jgi:hypothetical protein
MMAEIDQKELTLLAAMAYGESYYKKDNFEEMAGIASVLIRQRQARGYATMQKFTEAEPSYSFVVKDGNPRYAQLINTTEKEVFEISESAISQGTVLSTEISAIKEHIETAPKKESAALKRQLAEKEKLLRKTQQRAAANAGHVMAYKAARNALEGGADYSNGAFFWDGWDVKTNYKNHPKVKQGIKIADPSHDVFGITENLVEIIKYKVTTVTKNGKKTQTKEEIGRYDHIYESTAGHGGTIFWKFNPDYVRLENAKEYK